MNIEYNPKKFLLLIPINYLREYFQKRHLLGELDWQQLGDKDKNVIFAAWQSLPERERASVGADFHDVAGLATKQGIQTLIEEGRFRRHNLNMVAELASVPSHAEKAFYVLLNHPRVFKVASQFNYADNLKRYWHPRRGLPKKAPNLTAEARNALKRMVSEYYVAHEGRGEFSDLDVYLRFGVVHYFIVYLADYPDTFVGYDGDGKLDRHPQRPAFDVVFQYDESRGHLRLYAEGHRDLRSDLEKIFSDTILSEELGPEPPGPAFNLDPLKNPNFPFVTEPADGVFSVALRSMQLTIPEEGGGRITFDLPPYSHGGDIHQLIDKGLKQTHWQLEDLSVDRVSMKFTFIHGKPRPKTVTFNLSSGSCPLKEDVAEHVVIRTCLKRWEIERE